ncbi:hypothetical protein HY949_02050 [Candidatus Gottesmanbacteria bacterium]|nr:hypothetical protein [Candidatus Gottesmanbacteria bacterium]
MPQMIRTTLLLPEDLLQMAKMVAVQQKTTVSAMVREGLGQRIDDQSHTTREKEPIHRLGVFKIGIKKAYGKRSDLYEEHLRRKMGY